MIRLHSLKSSEEPSAVMQHFTAGRRKRPPAGTTEFLAPALTGCAHALLFGGLPIDANH